jgi:hypothetical protein
LFRHARVVALYIRSRHDPPQRAVAPDDPVLDSVGSAALQRRREGVGDSRRVARVNKTPDGLHFPVELGRGRPVDPMGLRRPGEQNFSLQIQHPVAEPYGLLSLLKEDALLT